MGDGAHRTRGVTARTLDGLAVVFGQGDRRPSFYRTNAREAALVDPQGNVLEPLVRSPIREGARFRYMLGEGATAATCEAVIAETDVEALVAGVSLEGCVRITRRCVHPAGLVFERETARRSEEMFCPHVGRVRSEQRLDPPLPDVPAVQTVELVSYRVAGAPVAPPPPAFDCDAALLLPSDVQGACGPEWRAIGEARVEEGCAHRFTDGEATLEVRMTRRPDAGEAERALASVLAAAGAERRVEDARVVEHDGVVTAGAVEGRHVFVIETDGCTAERAARLVPVLRSIAAP